MTSTITAFFNDYETAQEAVDALKSAGIEDSRISVVANDSSGRYTNRADADDVVADRDVKAPEGVTIGAIAGAALGLGALLIPGVGPVIAGGPLIAGLVGGGVGALAGGVTGGITASLVKLGVDEDTAGYYAEGLRRGGALVAVDASDETQQLVIRTLESKDPVELDSRVAEWQESGWTGYDPNAEPYTTEQVDTYRSSYASATPTRSMSTTDMEDEVRVPVIEETMRVGKMDRERGRVNVHTYTTDTPVSEQVSLREERVTVDRTPVDRAATSADFGQDATYEFTERAEEAVVQKDARVVEEVVVRKQADQRVETVSDTVRRQDVEVDYANDSTWNEYNTRFQQHYQTNYGSTGGSYTTYEPAYRYGYTSATDPLYTSYTDWSQAEPELRRNWERDYGSSGNSTWENIKDAVRNAWDSVRGRR